MREAQYGGRVTHPNVVRTIEIGEAEPGLHFLGHRVGGRRDPRALRQAPLPAARRPRSPTSSSQIADAVQAAHDAGIVHRDLKPENVMYDPATRQVKLLDFGIAADADQTADERLTRAGFFVGTLMYVAPEALSGELVTPAADQYSLATIAYFLLSGVPAVHRASRRARCSRSSSRSRRSRSSKAKEGLLVSPRRRGGRHARARQEPEERYPDVKRLRPRAAGRARRADARRRRRRGLFGKLKGMFKR